MNTPEETLDLMRDEFARIAADSGATEHIRYLCQRARMEITCRVPLIAQRDRAERELVLARTAIMDALDHLKVNRDIDGNSMADSDAAIRLQRALPHHDSPVSVHVRPMVRNNWECERCRGGGFIKGCFPNMMPCPECSRHNDPVVARRDGVPPAE